MSEEQTLTTNDEYPPFPDSPPDGVYPNLWGMLKTIHKEVAKIGYLDDKIGIIDDQLDKDGADIAQMKVTIQQLVSSQKNPRRQTSSRGNGDTMPAIRNNGLKDAFHEG